MAIGLAESGVFHYHPSTDGCLDREARMVVPGRASSAYILGHSERELERLRVQAQLVDPITRQFLIEAGVTAGMRILDVGSGAGDVTFLAAGLVGPTGHVTGVDRSATALDRARLRAREKSIDNVQFVEGDLSDLALEQRFDAAIGRYVLCFLPEPALTLRAISRLVRPGGIILFHEPERKLQQSFPPASSYDRVCRWLGEAYRRSGMDEHFGIKLYATFLAAGLAPPTLRLHATIGGANARDEIRLEAGQAGVLAEAMAEMGIVTPAELDADTLVARITRELEESNGIIVGRAEIGAWTRVRETTSAGS
jgi:SAM-dependent methyltransferase